MGLFGALIFWRRICWRQNVKFIHNGYLIVFDKDCKKDPIIKFWRCERKYDCKACIHTKVDVVIANINEHSHGASAASVEIRLELRLRFNVGFTCYSTIKVFIIISSSPYILFQFQSAPKYWAPKSTGLHRAS